MSNEKLNELALCEIIIQDGKENEKIEFQNGSIIQSILVKKNIRSKKGEIFYGK